MILAAATRCADHGRHAAAEIGDVMPTAPNQADQHIMALPLREAREMFERNI
jgi:hypothetical protein